MMHTEIVDPYTLTTDQILRRSDDIRAQITALSNEGLRILQPLMDAVQEQRVHEKVIEHLDAFAGSEALNSEETLHWLKGEVRLERPKHEIDRGLQRLVEMAQRKAKHRRRA